MAKLLTVLVPMSIIIHFGSTQGEFEAGSQIKFKEEYNEALLNLREYFAKEVVPNGIRGNPKERKMINGNKIAKRTFNMSEKDKSLDREVDKRDSKLHSDLREDLPVEEKYLNEWVVHMSGDENIAKSIIEELGYRFHGPIKGFPDVYRVSHLLPHHNSKRETESITSHIASHTQVLWAEQQQSRRRDKRGVPRVSGGVEKHSYQSSHLSHKGKFYNGGPRNVLTFDRLKDYKHNENLFDDPLWMHQWYLFDSRTSNSLPNIDLKVIPVWNSGITGKGVTVVVLDDGLEWNHQDLKLNYNQNISYDLNDDDGDPTPRYDSSRSNSHGTKCAGEIAMGASNKKCGVGIAYGASIGGIRMLDGDISDRIEGGALAMGLDSVDIVSCSWGPSDDGMRVEGPGTLARMALERGVKEGRKGKGIIFVWASGNGGLVKDNCNCDGYASSIYTISISSASENGESPWYCEHCASTLASTYSSGAYSDQKIVTTDIENDCTVSFSGTSAAAPLAAGIVALALEANPSLTWRDMQHAIVRSSDWLPLSRDKDWLENGVGLRFNIKFGFGLLTAEALVNAARNWTTVPEKKTCQTDAIFRSSLIESGGTLKLEIEPICTGPKRITALEHVQVITSLNHTRRGALRIFLFSPSGTATPVLMPRPKDTSAGGFFEWPFTSVHTWGEDPHGIWTVSISDMSKSGEKGIIESVSLILHGTSSFP